MDGWMDGWVGDSRTKKMRNVVLGGHGKHDLRTNSQNFLQYQNISAQALRSSLKEPLKTQSASRNLVNYRLRTWKDGVRQSPYVFNSITAAGKAVQ